MALGNIDKMPKTTFKAEELLKFIPKGFYYYLSLFLAVGCIKFKLWYFSISKSIKKASIFNKNYKDKNEQHFQILKVLFLCGILGGLYFNTRLNWKRAFFLYLRCFTAILLAFPIYKTTAHGLFRTPIFHFRFVFDHFLPQS